MWELKLYFYPSAGGLKKKKKKRKKSRAYHLLEVAGKQKMAHTVYEMI